jgi:hypothetical protein
MMSTQLQQVLDSLGRLAFDERWQVVEYWMRQLKDGFIRPLDPPRPKPTAQEILRSTCGSWGNKTIDEIDAHLEQQRSIDWG